MSNDAYLADLNIGKQHSEILKEIFFNRNMSELAKTGTQEDIFAVGESLWRRLKEEKERPPTAEEFSQGRMSKVTIWARKIGRPDLESPGAAAFRRRGFEILQKKPNSFYQKDETAVAPDFGSFNSDQWKLLELGLEKGVLTIEQGLVLLADKPSSKTPRQTDQEIGLEEQGAFIPTSAIHTKEG